MDINNGKEGVCLGKGRCIIMGALDREIVSACCSVTTNFSKIHSIQNL